MNEFSLKQKSGISIDELREDAKTIHDELKEVIAAIERYRNGLAASYQNVSKFDNDIMLPLDSVSRKVNRIASLSKNLYE